MAIPANLEPAYLGALYQLPALASAGLAVDRDEAYIRCALCAVAAAKAQHDLAEAVLELSPDVVDDFWEWFHTR